MSRIDQKQLAKTVKTKREQLNLSQLDLANKTHINRAIISKIENGIHMPSIEQLDNLKEVLHFSYEDLYKQNNSKPIQIKPKKIAVAGTGYVGLSMACLLGQHNQVVAVDIIEEKVDMINNKKSPIQDD